MEDVLESLQFILSRVDPEFTKERISSEWDRLFTSVIFPLYEKYPESPEFFVADFHEYLRVTLRWEFKLSTWNFFLSLEDTANGCNCICGTMLVLLACYSVGFFPQRVMGGFIEGHAFIPSPTKTSYFETTRNCKTTWRSIHEFQTTHGIYLPYQRFLVISSIETLLALYAVNVTLAEKLSLEDQEILLDAYPDPDSPAYLYQWVRWGIARRASIPVLLEGIQTYVTVIETLKLAIAFRRNIWKMVSILTYLQSQAPPGYESTLEEEKQRILNLLEQSGKQNEAIEIFRTEAGYRHDEVALDLSRRDMIFLPPEIGQFTYLISLILSYNDLISLPPEIENLSLLQELRANNNQLTFLPPEIGHLSALRRLELSTNQLTSLPPEIGNLSSLQDLNLHNNQLTSLPSEITTLSSLQLLDLSNNQLTTLLPEIENMPGLTLYVSGNPLLI